MKHFNNRLLSIVLTALSLLAFAGCSSMDVNTASAPNANFSKYQTYAWAPQPVANTQTAQGNGAIFDQTVKSTVENQLVSKGLSPAPTGSPPDLLVSYSAKTKDSIVYGQDEGVYGWGWGPQVAYPVREGSIRLEFIDPKTNKAVWQGTASDVISSAGASQEQVADAVTKLIKKYPSA